MAISFASLIFSGELADFAPAGIGLVLYSAIAIGIVTALTSSFGGMMGIPQGIPAIIIGLIAANVFTGLPDGASRDEALASVLMAIACTSVLTGLSFLGMGRYRMSWIVRYIPYSVVGGFLAGTGWLLVTGAIRVMTGLTVGLDTISDLMGLQTQMQWVPGLLFGIGLFALRRRTDHFMMMPGALLAGTGLFYGVLLATGTSLGTAAASGWLLEPFEGTRLWVPLTTDTLAAANWELISDQVNGMLVVSAISVIALLLNATGVELATKSDIDLNRELECAGVANLVSGLGGGMVGFQAISLSLLTDRFGAGSRLTALIAAGVCGAALFVGGDLLTLFPKFILGGVLMALGIGLLFEWLIESWPTHSRLDHLAVITIVIVIATVGLLEGIAVGVTLAVFLLAVDLSRVDAVKHTLSGSDHTSHVERSHDQRYYLKQQGERIYLLELQGFIFFGTANTLVEQMRERCDNPNQTRVEFAILDFRRVIGIDSSAVLSLKRLQQLMRARRITLIFTNLAEKAIWKLRGHSLLDSTNVDPLLFDDLEQGLEWCEERLLAQMPHAGEKANVAPLGDLGSLLAKGEPGAEIWQYLERQELSASQTLIAEGTPPMDMYFVQSGQVSVYLQLPEGRKLRIRRMNAGTVVGEIGVYLDIARTATVIAEEPTVVYRLSRDALDAMEREVPAVASAFHRAMVCIQGERLASLNSLIRALLR
jgi:SulP family sulfate permease